MEPFGFLHNTELVGRGFCNNPFPAGDENKHSLHVANHDSSRSGFNNHAFIEVNGKIADACAGPHLATESLADYITAAIQGHEQTDLYRQNKKRPGEVDDVSDCTGVESLDRCPIKSEHTMKHDLKQYYTKSTIENIESLMDTADTEDDSSFDLLPINVPAIRAMLSPSGENICLDVRVNQYGGQVIFTIPEISEDGLALQETQITIVRVKSCEIAKLFFKHRLDDYYHNVPLEYFKAAAKKKG